jgi:hypothetical protein
MVTHDFSTPIPPGTVRISVIHSGESFTIDLASAKLGDTVQAFEDHCDAGPLTADRCMAVAAEAANDGDAMLVTAAALWLWLFHPIEGVLNTGRLGEMITSHGSALLTAMVCEKTGEWTHRIYAMPRWPPGVAPHRATSRDLRRRWR